MVINWRRTILANVQTTLPVAVASVMVWTSVAPVGGPTQVTQAGVETSQITKQVDVTQAGAELSGQRGMVFVTQVGAEFIARRRGPCTGVVDGTRTDGLPYSPVVVAPCGGTGQRGPSRTGT